VQEALWKNYKKPANEKENNNDSPSEKLIDQGVQVIYHIFCCYVYN